MPQTTFALPQLHVGHSIGRVGPLTVIPVWTDAPVPQQRSYALPEEGALGLMSEHDDGPVVSELICTNDGDAPLLLLEGMTLDGGWQHRVVASSLLAGPRQRTVVPVHCIEQSRWNGGTSQHFSGHEAPLNVRASLRDLDGPHGASQARVWQRVAEYERRTGSASATNSLHVLHERMLRETEAVAVRPLLGQRGVIIGVLGQPVAAEIADHPDTLAQRWDSLLQSLLLDVRDVPFVPMRAAAARAFAYRLSQQQLHTAGDAGIGRALRNGDERHVSVRGIADQGSLLHAAVINTRHELVLAA